MRLLLIFGYTISCLTHALIDLRYIARSSACSGRGFAAKVLHPRH